MYPVPAGFLRGIEGGDSGGKAEEEGCEKEDPGEKTAREGLITL